MRYVHLYYLHFEMLIPNIAFIALISLAWAVTLSVYLSKSWVHFTVLQRELNPLAGNDCV